MIEGQPLPEPDEDSRPFWEGCARDELLMQRCASCRRFRFYPRPMCPSCRSFESTWEKMSGRGTIYSWIVAHKPVMPAFADLVPLVDENRALARQGLAVSLTGPWPPYNFIGPRGNRA